MAALPRRSPKLQVGLPPSPTDLVSAIAILEDMPRVPQKSPLSSSDDGYEGEIVCDGAFLYLYRGGQWVRAALSTF